MERSFEDEADHQQYSPIKVEVKDTAPLVNNDRYSEYEYFGCLFSRFPANGLSNTAATLVQDLQERDDGSIGSSTTTNSLKDPIYKAMYRLRLMLLYGARDVEKDAIPDLTVMDILLEDGCGAGQAEPQLMANLIALFQTNLVGEAAVQRLGLDKKKLIIFGVRVNGLTSRFYLIPPAHFPWLPTLQRTRRS
eukprot:gene26660-35335_t